MQIEVEIENEDGAKVHTFDKNEIIVGRGKDCDLRIVAEGISRKHARIFKEGSALMIEDLGSSNGTFINDEKIKKQELTSFFPAKLGLLVSVRLIDL